MRKMLFLLLFIPSINYAQSKTSIEAFINSKPKNLGRPVSLPDHGYFLFNEMLDSAGRYKRSFFAVISSDSDYHKIFSQYIYTKYSLMKWNPAGATFYYKLMSTYLIDSLPLFDFTKQELVLYAACGQCLAFCRHRGQENEPCHRNACYYQQVWFVRDKVTWIVKKSPGDH